MTTFTDRARAEAEDAATIAHSPIRREDGNTYDSDEHIAYRRGFVAGAEWGASQEPTDAEVEAARSVLDEYEYADEPQAIRAALIAAREARA
ncbi:MULTISPECIES: hypothetical protein [Brachybacterium]|uniref:Uncharacterized protein n=1 Tax=Brachybacterium kimchii TaxID=2942909 RepID=A0ABY4N7N0_9MICO|nr:MULTISPECIES: hypothetical protein [Brachybacterium]MCG7309714.1 hypothetical protein [Brachybacterium sp. ACRRE]UQN30561.1 hypothetical protein M4486_04410 [Brachybacterium kimchii]